MRQALKIVQKHFPNVKSVVDAKRSLIAEVTPADLKLAKRKDHAKCAMAVACKRSKSLDGMLVSTSIAYAIKGNKATRYVVPNNVNREVTAFDRGAEFALGVYRLFPPYHSKGIETRDTDRKGPDKRRGHHSKGKQKRQAYRVGVRVALGTGNGSNGKH